MATQLPPHNKRKEITEDEYTKKIKQSTLHYSETNPNNTQTLPMSFTANPININTNTHSNHNTNFRGNSYRSKLPTQPTIALSLPDDQISILKESSLSKILSEHPKIKLKERTV